MLFALPFLVGCETFFTREVTVKAGGMNFDPPILIDYSAMPEGSVTVESKQSGGLGVERHTKEVYSVRGPARITIEPLIGEAR